MLASARADVLQLASGGKLAGTLREATLLVGDEEITYARDQIKSIKLARSGRIIMKTQKGKTLRGELVSLKFRSLAGELTFARENVVSVKLLADPLAAVRKKLAAKRAEVADEDDEGLLELARWCRERGLKTDAVECARACLEAEPDAECAGKAHKFLGHVQYEGQWMTPAEAMRKEEQDKADSPADETGDPEKSVGPTAEEFKVAARQNEELYETFKQRVEDAREKELETLRKEHGKKWQALDVQIKSLAEEIKEREKNRESERERHRKELQAERHTKAEIEELLNARFDNFNSAYNTKIRAVREARLNAKLERTKLAGIIKPMLNNILRKAAQANASVRLAFQKHERILRGGKLLTADQMTKSFEAALEKD
ncbi:MAG: hypothetical protein ABIF82_04905 [Planctomycetota bacterium]